MRLLAERKCVVSHNPVSNLRLGAGIADTLAMRRLGCRVGIGVDGHGSGVECQDMLGTAKLACLLPNVRTPEYRSWLRPRDVLLEMACSCGRAAVGLDRGADGGDPVGVGAVADLCLYDLTAFSLLPRADPFTSLLLSGGRPSAGGPQLKCAWVGGDLVVSGGRPTRADLPTVRREILRITPSFYPPVDILPAEGERSNRFEVEYRAGLGLPLDRAR